MRALYLKDLKSEIHKNIVTISGEKANHLRKVVRIKVGEKILLLNGNGFSAEGLVESYNKKEIQVKILESKHKETKGPFFDLAFCTPKKNACDEIFKIATELGVGEIHPIHSEYSSRYPLNFERVGKVLESALIQSNNPYFPKVNDVLNFNDLGKLFVRYDKVFTFSSTADIKVSRSQIKGFKKGLVVIGPEGGFSPEEEVFLENEKKTTVIHLPTPILRAPHALSVAVGFLVGCLIE